MASSHDQLPLADTFVESLSTHPLLSSGKHRRRPASFCSLSSGSRAVVSKSLGPIGDLDADHFVKIAIACQSNLHVEKTP